MKKWEYKLVSVRTGAAGEDQLNKLGDEGWKAVSAVSALGAGPGCTVLLRRSKAK